MNTFENYLIETRIEKIALCLHLQTEGAAYQWAIRAGLISEGEKFRKNPNWQESAAVYFEAAFCEAVKMIQGGARDLGAILSNPALATQGRRAARRWKRNGIDGRDGREVPAEWFKAARLSANRPHDFDEWADNDETIEDLNVLDQMPFDARVTYRPSFIDEVRAASRKISASISARIESATSGAAAAAIRRAGADELDFLEKLENFLTGRGGFDEQEYAELFDGRGFETPLLRQKKCRLKKRLGLS